MCFLTSVITWAEIHMYHKSYTCMPTIIYWDRYSQSLERKLLTFFLCSKCSSLDCSCGWVRREGKGKGILFFLVFLDCYFACVNCQHNVFLKSLSSILSCIVCLYINTVYANNKEELYTLTLLCSVFSL